MVSNLVFISVTTEQTSSLLFLQTFRMFQTKILAISLTLNVSWVFCVLHFDPEKSLFKTPKLLMNMIHCSVIGVEDTQMFVLNDMHQHLGEPKADARLLFSY